MLIGRECNSTDFECKAINPLYLGNADADPGFLFCSL